MSVDVLVAPDKFKGTLSAAEVARHLRTGLERAGVRVRELPLADGGDGSVAAAVRAGSAAVPVQVTGAAGTPVAAWFAFDGTDAVVEVASTCGLATLAGSAPRALDASSLGLGEALLAALALRPRRVVLALGGSASTDGGAGLLAALGVRLLDVDGHVLPPGGGSLERLARVDRSDQLDLGGVELVVAGDVDNPLLGSRGAAAVFGPQKGAGPADADRLERGLQTLVTRLDEAGRPASAAAATPGAGAAGGLGFAGLLLGARLVSGADFFLDLLHFEQHLAGCALVVTGEGRLDAQTAGGKLVAVATRRAGGVPVVAVVGQDDLGPERSRALGLQAVHPLTALTDVDPATDPVLSAELLVAVGARIGYAVSS